MKRNFTHPLTILLFSITIFFSCKHDPVDNIEPDPNPPPDTVAVIQCDPDTTYFQNDVLPIFQSSCALSGCHDATTAQHGLILSGYEQIISSGHIQPGDAEDSEIYEKISEDDDDDRMPPPPFPRLTTDQITKIRDWINQGAKNNYCETDCDTTIFTFSGAVKPIIDQTCKGCHNATLANGGVRLDSYEAIATVASDGRLLGTITHAQGYPAMPFNGNKLPDCKITQIRKWVEAGIPNN